MRRIDSILLLRTGARHWLGISLLIPSFACAQAAAQDFMAAASAYQQGEHQRCEAIFMAMERDKTPLPPNGELLRAACLGAAGNTEKAITYLDALLPTGRLDPGALHDKDSPGLNAIRRSPHWPAFLARAEASERQRLARLDQPLRTALLARVQQDQNARQAIIDHPQDKPALSRMAQIDRDNTAWLKQVIDTKGWPSAALVGEDGANAAWLLVQHADADPAFQAAVLPQLEDAVARREGSPAELALLTDRVLLAQGKPQRYGTQFHTGSDGTLRMRPVEVEDLAGLDARCRAVGLPTLAAYKQGLRETYRTPVE